MIDLSIVVTCFNKKDFIPGFMSHCSELLDEGIEIIIVDDGSTDGSTDLLKSLVAKSPQIQLFVPQNNFGSANARNQGIRFCNRNYIFFLDIDDLCNTKVLKNCVSELSSRKCDYLIANLLVKPQNELFRMPVEVPIASQFETPKIASHILETMGYSRFIYSREFIEVSQFRFFPTRSESQSQNFILDDAFWLLLISASKSNALVCEKERVVYYYNRPKSSVESWAFYLAQLKLIPNLIILFLNLFLNNEFLIGKSLVEHSTKWMFRVLRPLDFYGLISSGIFSREIFNSLSYLFKLKGLSHLILLQCYLFTLLIALKNSIRIRTRLMRHRQS